MCLSNLFCGNDCTWAWILFIVGILLLLENNCGGNGCGCGNTVSNGCGNGCGGCGCGTCC